MRSCRWTVAAWLSLLAVLGFPHRVASIGSPCDSNPCQNEATCLENAGGYTCTCPTGYTGITCNTDINECEAISPPCLNGATCSNNNGSFACTCVGGYSGQLCDTDINECVLFSALCLNGATCLNNDGSYTCICVEGYSGQFCEAGIPIVIVTDPADGLVFRASYTEQQNALIPTLEVHRASVQNFAVADPICRITVRLRSGNEVELDSTDELIFTSDLTNTGIQSNMVSSTEARFSNGTAAEQISNSAWRDALTSLRYRNLQDEPSLAQRQVTITPVLCSGLEGRTSLSEILVTRINDKPPTLAANLYKDL